MFMVAKRNGSTMKGATPATATATSGTSSPIYRIVPSTSAGTSFLSTTARWAAMTATGSTYGLPPLMGGALGRGDGAYNSPPTSTARTRSASVNLWLLVGGGVTPPLAGH